MYREILTFPQQRYPQKTERTKMMQVWADYLDELKPAQGSFRHGRVIRQVYALGIGSVQWDTFMSPFMILSFYIHNLYWRTPGRFHPFYSFFLSEILHDRADIPEEPVCPRLRKYSQDSGCTHRKLFPV